MQLEEAPCASPGTSNKGAAAAPSGGIEQLVVPRYVRELFVSVLRNLAPELRERPLNPSKINEEMRRMDRSVISLLATCYYVGAITQLPGDVLYRCHHSTTVPFRS